MILHLQHALLQPKFTVEAHGKVSLTSWITFKIWALLLYAPVSFLSTSTQIQHQRMLRTNGTFKIWISPVVENLVGNSQDGEGYHGYWAQNIYEVNSNFGTAADLKNLSTQLHNRGMYLMVDVVTNHMGYLGCGTCVNYADFTPFNSVSIPLNLSPLPGSFSYWLYANLLMIRRRKTPQKANKRRNHTITLTVPIITIPMT